MSPYFATDLFRYESCMTRVTVASPPLTSTNELTGPDVGSAQAPPATLLLGRLLAIFYSFKMMMRLPIQIGSQRLSTSTTTPSIVAVGGAPLPWYETARPRWFPLEFDWVFGCAYRGLPTFTAPAWHLIGANLTVPHSAFDAVGGFHSVDFDDFDLCLRLAAAFPGHYLMYEPRAVVYHHVPADRVSWQYFWRRPYYVNKAK